jgi:hypothetical protein
VTRPLHQLLAALPDLLCLAGCWDQLAVELFASGLGDVTIAEAAHAQLRTMLMFASSFAGEQITALLLPIFVIAGRVGARGPVCLASL